MSHSASSLPEPELQNGFWVWRDQWQGIEVRFVGAGPSWQHETLMTALGEPDLPGVAWARQVHGKVVLPGQAGCCGEGDALWSPQVRLAVSVVTADCVPILLGGGGAVAAIHAGWRGIEAEIVSEALASMGPSPSQLTAWIGPSIGSCCYEVDWDVANRIERVSCPRVSAPGPRGKPHLDLVAAVTVQLFDQGVRRIRRVEACTRCQGSQLASYRRDGKRGGRNIALAWRRSAA